MSYFLTTKDKKKTCQQKNYLYIIDAFSNVPFEGNPAAVCLVEIEKVRLK